MEKILIRLFPLAGLECVPGVSEGVRTSRNDRKYCDAVFLVSSLVITSFYEGIAGHVSHL